MIVLVTGGRAYTDGPAVSAALFSMCPTLVVHGDATGADALADAWCAIVGVSVRPYPARWREEGRAAGPLGNVRMLADAKPDVVIAFPGGVGTADMVRKAYLAMVPVIHAK